MKHLKKFQNHTGYEAFTQTEDFILPNVSYCFEENEVHYNPLPIDEHQYVDLGLPSGTLWATMNIGAEEPLDSGYLFAWGEIDPVCCPYACGKDHFFWDSYRFSVGGSSVSYANPMQYKLNKYCPSGKTSQYYASGFTGDTLTQLVPADDAATVLWGQNWEIPTKEQLQELLDYTTFTSVYNNSIGRSIHTFTGQNGNSIQFISRGQSWSTYDPQYENNPCQGDTYPAYTFIWSKDLYSSGTSAYHLSICSSEQAVKSLTRAVGITIRPVRKQQS